MMNFRCIGGYYESCQRRDEIFTWGTIYFFSSNDKLKEFVKNGRECNVLFKIGFESYTFDGVTAQASLDLPKIDFTQIKPTERAAAGASSRRNMEANAGAGGSVAATATAGGAIAASVEWKGHDSFGIIRPCRGRVFISMVSSRMSRKISTIPAGTM
jgi:hypothetical protein